MASSQKITASELLYPKGMRDRIMHGITEAYVRWLVFQFKSEVNKHKKTLDAGGKIPTFRAGDIADELRNLYQGDGWQDKIRNAKNMDDGNRKILDTFFLNGGKHKDLKALDITHLHLVVSVFEALAQDRTASIGTRKAAFKLSQKLSKASMTGGPSELERQYATDYLKQSEEILSQLTPMVQGKVTGPAAKLASVKWEEKVDLSDLPDRYKRFEPTTKNITVHFRVDKRMKKWAGSYNSGSNMLTIYAPTNLPGVPVQKVIKKNMTIVEETVEHELRHMVQNMLQEAYGKKAGTRYGKGEDLPGNDPNEKMAHVDPKAYPSASKKDRYYLGPKEFYPNLETSVFRFKERFGQIIRKPTKHDFKVWVGLEPTDEDDLTIQNNGFFMAYKRNDPKRYKKAVQEAWTRLERFVS